MFEPDAARAAIDVLADMSASNFECFKAASTLKSIAEAAQAEFLAYLADENDWGGGDNSFDVVGARFVRIGADGTPLVDEALPLEIAVATGSSVGWATGVLRDVVNIKDRHPRLWEAVQEGVVPLWRAARVAQTCASFGLDAQETLQVDEQLRHVFGQTGWARANRLLKATIMSVAPERVEAKIEAGRQARYCHKITTDDPGTAMINACVDTADAVFFDAAIDRIADILGEQGDQTGKDVRRAKAVGVLASPARALQLLDTPCLRGVDPDLPIPAVTKTALRRERPRTQVYVHISIDTLTTGQGVVRVEKLGPAMVSQLRQILGHSHIKLAPAIHVGDTGPVLDGYEIPDRLAEQVVLRDRFEVFPYSSREARGVDLDHTRPYRAGRPGQTRASNLGPLSRRAHRVKTHGGWQLTQPAPGVFKWTTRWGQSFTIDPNGTHPGKTTNNSPP